MSQIIHGRNPIWMPEYTGMKPSFNTMGAMHLNPDHPLNQGLVAWWLMNEGAGGRLSEIVNYSHGELINGSWARDKIIGSTTSVLATVVHSDKYKSTTNIAIAIKASIISAGGGYWYGCEVSSSGWGIYGGLSPRAYMRIGSGWSDINTSTYLLNAGQYYCIVQSYDGATHSSYVDTNIPTTRNVTGAIVSNTQGMGIGAISINGSSASQINCEYMAIWSRGISQTDVNNLNLSPYGTPSNPRFLYQGSRSYFVPSSGVTPSFKPYWARNANQYLGARI
jgi:hypothetical protein